MNGALFTNNESVSKQLQQVGDSIGVDYGNYRFGIVTNKI
jgi:hypothetical protein